MHAKATHFILSICLWSAGWALLLTGCKNGPDQLDGVRQMKFELGYNLREIAWSPNGHSLAATVSSERGGTQVVVLDLDTGKVRLVSGVVSESSHGPEWSPDGQSLIFFVPSTRVSPLGGGPVELVPPYNIVIVDVATGKMVRNLGFGSYATWTADPNSIIILGQGECLEQVPIIKYELDNNTTYEIGSTQGCIAESADTLDASSQGILIAPGQDGLQLLDISSGSTIGTLIPPNGMRNSVWSPSGDMIAFTVGTSGSADGYLSDPILPTLSI